MPQWQVIRQFGAIVSSKGITEGLIICMAQNTMKITNLICRWLKFKTGWYIRSKNTTFKAFNMATNVRLTLQKLIIEEFFWFRLVLVRTYDICFESLQMSKDENIPSLTEFTLRITLPIKK